MPNAHVVEQNEAYVTATAKIMTMIRALNFPALNISTECTLPDLSVQLYSTNRASLVSIVRETLKHPKTKREIQHDFFRLNSAGALRKK